MHLNDLYKREIESIILLSKEEEIALNQAIDSNLKDILGVLTHIPESLDLIPSHFTKITQGQFKLDTLLHGFKSKEAPYLKPDLIQVQERLFKLLIVQYETQGALQNFGPKSPKTKECQARLLDHLTAVKWNGQIIEQLIDTITTTKKIEAYKLRHHLRQAVIAFKQAKESLIAGNLRLVVFIAKKYARLGLPFLDLVQEGNIGLMQAVEQFDIRWGYAFSSYAAVWIRHVILNAISKIRSLPIEEDLNLDKVEDQKTLSPLTLVSAQDLSKLTRQALSSLKPREADILRLRFGIDVPLSCTLAEIGDQFNVSREQIRQIEAKALKALRDQVEVSSLKFFLNNF